MLNDDQKALIRAEEIYRQEIRTELANREGEYTGKKRAWQFLNSIFGIWFLSTVAIGGLSLLYSSVQSSLAEGRARREFLRKLDTEISSRLVQWHELGHTPPVQDSFKDPNFVGYYNLLLKPTDLSGQAPFVIYPVYVDYEKWSLLSLIQELRSLADNEQKAELDLVIKRLIEWQHRSTKGGTFTEKRDAIREEIWLQRWARY